MKSKRIIGIILIAALALTGCNAGQMTVDTSVSESLEIVDTAASETETTLPETEALVPFEFNAHVYSQTMSERFPQEYWDSFYNLCDALRVGESSFECASQEAYEWAISGSALANLFPAACLKVDDKFNDGTVPFENGTGHIHYNMPVEEFVQRQADFEEMIVDILNSTLESDDTEYERALKLYLYVAENYDYDYSDRTDRVDENGYVYSTFMSHSGVCVNYGSVYAYLLLQVGIDAFNVGCFEDGMDHAWTYAVINGKGYHIDTTWALKSCYPGVGNVYLDYFMMSDVQRDYDGCLVRDLTVQLLPEFWVNRTSITLTADDDHYCIRDYCEFLSLDEENKIVHYEDLYGERKEFYYGD